MNENDMLMTTRVNLRGERGSNPYVHKTPEWHAWEAGYSAARSKAGRSFVERMR